MAESSKKQLKQGQTYSATLHLNALQQFGSNDEVANKLKEVGFTNVVVTGSGRTRQARGTWSKPSQQADVPKEVTDIKEARSIPSLG